MRSSFEHDKKQLISMNKIDTAIFEQVVKKYEEKVTEIISEFNKTKNVLNVPRLYEYYHRMKAQLKNE